MNKIKVLHIISNLNHGGAETMIMNIFRNIDKERFQFDFLCLSDVVGDYEEEVIKLGGNIYRVENSKEKVKTIFKIIKSNNYKAVHSHVMFYSGIIHVIAKIEGVPIRITHSHSSNDIKKKNLIRSLYMKVSRFLINNFSNVKLACGEKAGEYLYGKRQKFQILKNGIDLEKFTNITKEQVDSLKRELKIDNDEFIIGHVGSFLRVKNQEYFIEFAKELIKRNKKFKIVLVGYGERFEYIKSIIFKEKLQDYFILTGIRDDIAVFMNLFDVFIMPSLYEGFPLVVVEALAGNNICFLSNKVPEETNIINSRVNFFDLEEEKDILIGRIFKEINDKKDINIKEKLIDNGFSIKNMVNDISNIYLGQ